MTKPALAVGTQHWSTASIEKPACFYVRGQRRADSGRREVCDKELLPTT